MAIQFHFDKKSKKYYLLDSGKPLRQANRFLRALEIRGLSLMTIRAYGYDLVSFYRWLKKQRSAVKALTEAKLLKYIEHQQDKDAKPKSINRRLVTCRLFYRFCTGQDLATPPGSLRVGGYYKGPGKEGFLGLNPRSRYRFVQLHVKVPHRIVEPLTPQQVGKFFRTLKRYRDIAIVYLMLFCGLRSREVLELRLNDIDLVGRQFKVRGKGNKERLLPLPDILSNPLEQYIRLERPLGCLTSHLFVVLQGSTKEQPMDFDGLRSLFRYRRLDPKLNSANAHRFRHTFGTDMARTGVKLPVLQKIMGHSNAKTTLQYINLSMADIAEEYEKAIYEIKNRYSSKKR